MNKKVFPLRYWNANGVAVAIVAVVNYCDGELFDWAAYIGGTTETWREEDAYEHVAKHGCKLNPAEAKFFTSANFPITHYRS